MNGGMSDHPSSFMRLVILTFIAVLSCSCLRAGDTLLVIRGDVPHEVSDSLTGRGRKLLAGALAFPFPMGFIGAHRVMLGCKPWVPVVYVATLGGCFGILPLIDFIVILTSRDISRYVDHPGVFMWIE